MGGTVNKSMLEMKLGLLAPASEVALCAIVMINYECCYVSFCHRPSKY
jgi:hypothetical protein